MKDTTAAKSVSLAERKEKAINETTFSLRKEHEDIVNFIKSEPDMEKCIKHLDEKMFSYARAYKLGVFEIW